MIGKTILHYKITEKLGEGGMGIVYLAEDTKLKRQVAIKFLPPHIAASEEERERFKIEAQAAAALNHPNIATIYAIEETEDSQMFIVMEYIDGKELKEEARSGPLEIERAIDIATQIAEGLQAAHKKGIVHRDIKSANIMITGENKVKIMDFGLAKIGAGTQLTKDHSTLGTAAYMSPEQARGDEVDQRSDLWSFGIVLYEMLTGELPFKGEYEAAVIYEILNEEPQAIRLLRQDIPENMTTIIRDILQKDVSNRIKSTQELLERLKIKEPKSQIKDDEKSIAVLYFDNMSPDKDNDYFCAGITEDIIIDLSKILKLNVIPRSDVQPFRTKEVNSRKVGEILGVTHILEGSVRKAGQKIRVTAQLIDIQSGFQIWGERYDRLLEDIFELQVEVSQKIAEALKVSLSDSEKESLAHKPTEDLRAHDFYMRGRELLRAEGKKNNESAIKMFEHAISIDPNYALAYVAMAEAFSFQYVYYDGDQKWLGKIISTNDKARELDPELDEVEIARGMVFYHQKRFAEAKRTFEDFITRKDDNYTAHHWLGVSAELTGDLEAAIKHFKRSAEIKPYSEEPWMHQEMTYRRQGKLDLANSAGNKMFELVERKLSINTKDAIALSRGANYKVRIGDKNSAVRDLEKILDIAPNDGLALYNCACAYSQLNEKDEALVLLQRAIEIGFRNVIAWVESDPDFEAIRDDARFKEILDKAGE